MGAGERSRWVRPRQPIGCARPRRAAGEANGPATLASGWMRAGLCGIGCNGSGALGAYSIVKFIHKRSGAWIMAERVADVLWSMLAGAGVKRCYGIIGDALNPVIDALASQRKIEFIHVRNEEPAHRGRRGVQLHREPVVVCGTAGPGATNLLSGLIDASPRARSGDRDCGDTVSLGWTIRPRRRSTRTTCSRSPRSIPGASSTQPRRGPSCKPRSPPRSASGGPRCSRCPETLRLARRPSGLYPGRSPSGSRCCGRPEAICGGWPS